MKIYHGSKRIIKEVVVGGSKPYNDYGPAFYMTTDFESACEWACRNNSVGYVNEYDLNMKGLKILDLTNHDKYSCLNWIAILLHFRELDDGFKKAFIQRIKYIEEHYYIDVNEYDVIIGYRADDAYFRFPLDFIRGNLTIEQLENSFKLGNLGVQYALISDKAIRQLSYIESKLSDEKYIGKYFYNVSRSTALFDSLDKDADGKRIIDIMREDK